MPPTETLPLVPVGIARTPWSRGNCPHNMAEARRRGGGARIEIAEKFRGALLGIERASHVIALGWFQAAARDRLVQQPRHMGQALGAFSLRSPDRPNPIAVSVVRLDTLDLAAGIVGLEALDWYDGTPVLDLKPYYASVDAVPEAVTRDPDSG